MSNSDSYDYFLISMGQRAWLRCHVFISKANVVLTSNKQQNTDAVTTIYCLPLLPYGACIDESVVDAVLYIA